MYFYKAFGLVVSSEVEMPQFIPAEESSPAVSIRYGDVRSRLSSEIAEDRAVQSGPSEICFYWRMAGHYCARDGNEIIVEPAADVDERVTRIPLIGIVFAAILKQREMLVLHGSAVALANGVSVFLGGKGAGKSTTAATLYKRGFSLISDDIVAIPSPLSSETLSVLPGFPSFKLMPECAAEVLGDDPAELEPIYNGAIKLFRSTNGNFINGSRKLNAVYVLEESDDMRATLLGPQMALPALIANTYLARYGKQLMQNDDAVTNLQQVARITSMVPVYRLERPKSFELTEELADFLESHQESPIHL